MGRESIFSFSKIEGTLAKKWLGEKVLSERIKKLKYLIAKFLIYVVTGSGSI